MGRAVSTIDPTAPPAQGVSYYVTHTIGDLHTGVSDANIADITLMSTYERSVMNYEIGVMSVYNAQWGRGVYCHMLVFYADGEIAVMLFERVRGWSVMNEDLEHIKAIGGEVKTVVDNDTGVVKVAIIGDVDEVVGISCLSMALLGQLHMEDGDEEI